MDSILYSAEAENLSKLFISLLESNPAVKFIPSNWRQTYPAAIQQLIGDYGDASAVEKIIRFSQNKKWSKYIVRLEMLVKKAQDIWSQILTIEYKQQQRESEQDQYSVQETDLNAEQEIFATVTLVEEDEENFG